MRAWALVVAAGCAATPEPAPTPASPDVASGPHEPAAIEAMVWLAGHWVSRNGEGHVEELWTAPAGGTMLGTSRTIAGERTVFFEFLAVREGATALEYVAQPTGRCPPTVFTATAMEPDHARFENPAHDFPTAIDLRRDGNRLLAEISGPGPDGPRRVTWTYERAP